MPSLFDMNIRKLKGIGEKRAQLYEKLGVPTVGDLLRFYPRAYEDWSNTSPIASCELNEVCVVKAKVLVRPKEQRIRGGKLLYKTIATDGESDLALTFFNNKYIPNLLKEDEEYIFRGKMTGSLLKREMLSPEFVQAEKSQSIVPIYHQTQGLTSRIISAAVKNALALLPETINDPISDEIRHKHELCHLNFALQNIHFPESEESLAIARRRLIFEEFLVLQIGMIQLKSGTKEENLHKVKNEFPHGFTELLSFSLTGAQKRAISEALGDMSGAHPMNRLVQGDVGSGKTAVAAALCYVAAKNGMQSAMMAPTEILAAQHYHSLSELLAPDGINVALLTGSISAAEKRQTLAALSDGSIDLVVGTHALISEGVEFKRLALVITDEQHRFGVGQRSALAKKGSSPHLLVMSATPIPRTLALMIYGDLDISVLDELPPGRQKIETYLIDSSKRSRAFGYVQKHLDEGRQGYLICPLIEEGDGGSELSSIEEYSKLVKASFPKARIKVLHGKLKPAQKEEVMREFADGAVDLLVATTVVEVGVDVPNAVIMLIENAERYGLSQLHQLRGRVGRGKHKSTCILLSDAAKPETLQRLKVMCGTADGFKIAEADLKLRGPGDFFGHRQHGLPQLKLADMMSDMALLTEAQGCAREIAPDIAEDRYRGLRAEVRLLFEKTGSGDVVI